MQRVTEKRNLESFIMGSDAEQSSRPEPMPVKRVRFFVKVYSVSLAVWFVMFVQWVLLSLPLVVEFILDDSFVGIFLVLGGFFGTLCFAKFFTALKRRKWVFYVCLACLIEVNSSIIMEALVRADIFICLYGMTIGVVTVALSMVIAYAEKTVKWKENFAIVWTLRAMVVSSMAMHVGVDLKIVEAQFVIYSVAGTGMIVYNLLFASAMGQMALIGGQVERWLLYVLLCVVNINLLIGHSIFFCRKLYRLLYTQ